MDLLQRWQLKDSAKKQLLGKWGQMALKCFWSTIIPLAIAWGIPILLGICFTIDNTGNLLGLDYHVGFIIWTVVLLIMPVLYIGAVIVALALQFGFIDSCIKLRSGEDTSVGAIFGKFRMLPKILLHLLITASLTSLPYMIVINLGFTFTDTIAIVLVFVSTLLFIYATLRMSMSIYIILENPYTSVWTAIKQSWNMMHGHCLRYFILALSFLGWWLIVILSFGIGIFWIVPYIQMTIVNFYYNVKEVCLYKNKE